MVQVHVRFIVGFDCSYIAPVGRGVDLAGDSVLLEIVGIHRRLTSQFGQNVHAEIMMAAGSFRVSMQQIQKRAGGKNVVAHGGVHRLASPGIVGASAFFSWNAMMRLSAPTSITP